MDSWILNSEGVWVSSWGPLSQGEAVYSSWILNSRGTWVGSCVVEYWTLEVFRWAHGVSYHRVRHCTAVEYWTPEVLGWTFQTFSRGFPDSLELSGVSNWKMTSTIKPIWHSNMEKLNKNTKVSRIWPLKLSWMFPELSGVFLESSELWNMTWTIRDCGRNNEDDLEETRKLFLVVIANNQRVQSFCEASRGFRSFSGILRVVKHDMNNKGLWQELWEWLTKDQETILCHHCQYPESPELF